MHVILEQLINGLTIGSFYALIALGYSMVYGVLKLINFAHGDFFTLGSYLGYTVLVFGSALITTHFGLWGGLMLAMMMTGLDQVTAFSAIAATLNNLGPGLGEVALNYASIGMVGKWICVFAMLLGRLEIFTLIILFTVTFWRK